VVQLIELSGQSAALFRQRQQPRAARVGGMREVLLLGGEGVRVAFRSPGQLCLPLLQARELGLRSVQALLSLGDPVAGRLRFRLLPRQRVIPGAVQRGEHAGQRHVLQPLDTLLLARVLFPGRIQVRRRGLLACAQQGVQLPAQVMFAGRPRRRGQPLLDLVRLRHRRSTTRMQGGHFAAWEQPRIFSEEVRAGLRPLRE
jgi:hypothetical protein